MKARLFGDKYVEVDPAVVGEGGWRKHKSDEATAWGPTALHFFWHRLMKLDHPLYLDIGANTGIFTLLTAIAPESYCVAFEPNPELIDGLLGCIKLNQLRSRVRVEAIALGDTNCTTTLHVPKQGQHGMSRVGLPGDLDNWRGIQVAQVTLDAWAEQYLRSPIHLIKIDVEGFEKFVLLGGERTIRQDKPDILLERYEPHPKHYGYTVEDLDVLLASWGYIYTKKICDEDTYYSTKEIE